MAEESGSKTLFARVKEGLAAKQRENASRRLEQLETMVRNNPAGLSAAQEAEIAKLREQVENE